jgi:hypothetical protein
MVWRQHLPSYGAIGALGAILDREGQDKHCGGLADSRPRYKGKVMITQW